MSLDPAQRRPRPHARSRPSLPGVLLRIEGLALFVAASSGFLIVGGSPGMLLVWLLAPDLVALGYLAGPRFGAVLYDLGHATPAPLALLLVGVAWEVTPAVLAATVWLAHLGTDRAIGYGLTYPGGNGSSHLQRV